MKLKLSAALVAAYVLWAPAAHANFLSPGSPATSLDVFTSITGPVWVCYRTPSPGLQLTEVTQRR